MRAARHEAPLDPSLASPGEWRITPTEQTMHDGTWLPTFAVVTTGGAVAERFVGRAHPLDGRPEDRPILQMNARLFAASKEMAALLVELLAYEAEQFDGDEDGRDLSVSGADTVDWLGEFRLRVRAVIGTAAAGGR